jgi:hypothetical protein
METGSDEACVRVLVTSQVWEEDTKPRMPAIGCSVPFSWAVARVAVFVCEVRVVQRRSSGNGSVHRAS